MAPPIPLANVVGTFALSFTAGPAAPASASPPVQQPSVPVPPTLPPVPGETATPTTEPTTTEPSTSEPTTATTEPATTTSATAPSEPTTEAPARVEPVWGPPSMLDGEESPLRATPAPAARLLRPNRNRLMFSLFAGSAKGLRSGYSYLPDFKLEGAIGGHNASFRVGGFMVAQVASGLALNSFTFAPRLSLNRQIVPNHAFYLTTNMTLGYRLSVERDDGDSYDNTREVFHSAVLGVSWGATAIVAERLLLSFRPLDVELMVPSPEALVQINLSFMGGVGLVWGNGDDDDR